MTEAEAARAAATERADATALESARERYARLAALCGLSVESLPQASAAEVAYGLPVLTAALERIAERLAAIDAGKDGGG